MFLYLLLKYWLCSPSLSPTHHDFAQNGHQNNLLSFPGSSQQVCLSISHSFIAKIHCSHAGFSLPSESGEWIIRNAIVKCFLWIMFCTAVACSAQDAYLNYWYFSSGFLLKNNETKSDCLQKGQPILSHYKVWLKWARKWKYKLVC